MNRHRQGYAPSDAGQTAYEMRRWHEANRFNTPHWKKWQEEADTELAALSKLRFPDA